MKWNRKDREAVRNELLEVEKAYFAGARDLELGR